MRATTKSVEKLMSDLQVIIRDGEELLRAIPEDLSGKAKEARQRLQTAIDGARERYHELEERAVEGLKAADEAVHDYPYYFIGGAFGLGVLIGVLVARR